MDSAAAQNSLLSAKLREDEKMFHIQEPTPQDKKDNMELYRTQLLKLQRMIDRAISYEGPAQFASVWSGSIDEEAERFAPQSRSLRSDNLRKLLSDFAAHIPGLSGRSGDVRELLRAIAQEINQMGQFTCTVIKGIGESYNPYYETREIKLRYGREDDLDICLVKLEQFKKEYASLITPGFCEALAQWRGGGMEAAKARLAREEQLIASAGGQAAPVAIPLDARAATLQQQWVRLDVTAAGRLMPSASPSTDRALVGDYLVRNEAPLRAVVDTLGLIADSEERTIEEMRRTRKSSATRWLRERLGAARAAEDADFDVQIAPVIRRAEHARSAATQIQAALTELEYFRDTLPGPNVGTDMETAMQLPFALQEAGTLCGEFNNAYLRSSPRPNAMLGLLREAYPAAESLLGVFTQEGSRLQGLWMRLLRGDEEQRERFERLIRAGRRGFEQAFVSPPPEEQAGARGPDGRRHRSEDTRLPPSLSGSTRDRS